MSEIVLAAGSIAGVFTAMAIDRVSQAGSRSRQNGVIRDSYDNVELERRIIYKSMRRLYDYERAGKITSVEREKLLAKYRQQLDAFGISNSRFNGNDVNSFKSDLIALVDQRMSQINSKLDDLASRMNNDTIVTHKPISNVERKEDRPIVTKKVEQVTNVDTSETSESDASLDEIKKQIMQTLSRLEQAEVE